MAAVIQVVRRCIATRSWVACFLAFYCLQGVSAWRTAVIREVAFHSSSSSEQATKGAEAAVPGPAGYSQAEPAAARATVFTQAEPAAAPVALLELHAGRQAAATAAAHNESVVSPEQVAAELMMNHPEAISAFTAMRLRAAPSDVGAVSTVRGREDRRTHLSQPAPSDVIWEASPNLNPEAEEREAAQHMTKQLGLTALAKELLLDLGGGTGAAVGGTGDAALDKDLLRRMRYQDKAVMLLLLLAYVGSLAFSASLTYRQASNSSPVTYYADPRFHVNTVAEGNNAECFLEAFNQPPKDVQLQVTGLTPLPPLPEYLVDSAVEWLGARYRVAFSFALDLSPWVVREHSPSASERVVPVSTEESVGMSQEDLVELHSFLEHNTNDLAVLKLCKEVSWSDWEELAVNIKQRIRQSGFTGVITVRRTEEDTMVIYKNKPWANFMHSRTTKVLCALSIIGWFIYQPYMWLRLRASKIHSRFRVDISISAYWALIEDKIGPNGFDGGIAATL